LNSWSCGYCDAARHDGGSGDAEPSPGDEIAAGDNRSSMLFSRFRTDRLGRFASRNVVFRHLTSPFPER
jgi:hypothetical protein